LGKDVSGSRADGVRQTAVLQWLGKRLSVAEEPGDDIMHGYSPLP
jgi:hypothetical protein